MSVPTQRLAEADSIVTQSINKVLEHYNQPPLSFLAELFDVNANLLCTFPEFDHYQPRIPELQKGLYCGPIIETTRGIPLTWPDGPGKRVLVYLRPETRDWEAIMQALIDTGCSVIAAIPGISETQKMRMTSPRCQIFDHGIHLASVLPECDLAINYAGHGYISAVLAAGVPMLLAPMHLEQFLLAQRVSQLGASVTINPESPPPVYRDLLAEMLAQPSLKQAAQNFAAKYHTFNQQTQQEMIVQLIMQVAQS
jgi:UDP:flavonoid glycosyltransferase YjiC (YdhE family)